MSHALDDIRELLRSSDEVKAVLEATVIPNSNGSEPPLALPEVAEDRRILAVVSHKDDWDLVEEGCVFVCKSIPSTNGKSHELEIQRVLPIYGNFAIVMSQMRRNTLDLGKGTTVPTASSTETSRSGFSVAITPAEGLQGDAQPVVFFTRNVQDLRELVAECKRLRETSEVESNVVVNVSQSTTHFSWLRPYILKQISPSLLALIPPDLREVNKPLQERLSTSSAGQPGDDHRDIQTIRDEWVRSQARKACTTAKRSLRDIQRKRKTSVSGLVTLDSGNDNRNSIYSRNNHKFSSYFTACQEYVTVIARTSSSQASEKTAAEETIDPVDPDDIDPDVYVLGIQELDLSTEALLYSLGTAREDAWCRAVFASLGEKAEKYEKLTSKQLVGMLIVVIVKKTLKECFTDVKTTSAGAGILGVMGNKGATAVRLSFKAPGSTAPTTFTFVNAHLAAFDEMVDKRNLDFQDLSKRLVFEVTWPSEEDQELGYSLPTLTAYESDVLFWMGDLNYRIDIPDLELRRILREDDWDNSDKFPALLRSDQLTKAQKQGKAFVGFMEHTISYLPTYRFSPGLGMDVLGYDLK
ncbi:hypothetical protein H1R20_g14166, partial [Candolleomyces eurysporus]